MVQDIINNYEQRIAFAQTEARKYKDLANGYSLCRLLIFALFILSIYFSIVQDNFTVLVIAFIILTFGFTWLVSRQAQFEREMVYFQNLEKVNKNEIESILNYANIYDGGSTFADEKHYYSADLDIFGESSLFKLVNRAATSNGRIKLSEWLKAPSPKEFILLRQDGIKELVLKTDWKLEIQARLLFANKEDVTQLQKLFTYLNLPLNIPDENWLKKYSKIAPWLLLTAIVAACFYPAVKSVPVLIGLINLGIVFSKAVYIKKADLIAGKIGGTLSNYANVFEKIEHEQWKSAWCNDVAKKIISSRTSERIKELSDLINKLNYHLNMIVGFVLNLFFLWDIRQVIAIEDWKRNNTESLETAFDVIADFEALISLSSLALNYPEWCFPEIADSPAYTLIAQSLAHPLIDNKKRIENDYELGNTLKIDIITGSNMAGKSTFLRTIGINAVLALCGAPVCSRKMTLSVINVITYMRIKDSLNESTSTFKAELDRLQMLLAAVENKPKVFFLIDEMLRGTNSVDKYLGSKAVIEQLIRKKGVGMVATHDLQIAELENNYPDYIRNFYFDIQVQDGEMLFDYKIKHGECKTFNASLLLKQIGIDIDAE